MKKKEVTYRNGVIMPELPDRANRCTGSWQTRDSVFCCALQVGHTGPHAVRPTQACTAHEAVLFGPGHDMTGKDGDLDLS